MILTTELFELPPSFTNTRINSLYSDFRKMELVNPEGFNANINAWKAALSKAVGEGNMFPDSLIISAGPDLITKFETSSNGVPLALDVVFDQLVAKKQLIPLYEFVKPNRASLYYQPKWYSIPTPSSVVTWALSKAGLYNPAWKSSGSSLGSLKQEKYVFVAGVEVISKALLNQLKLDITSPTSGRLSKNSASQKPLHEIVTFGAPSGYTRSVFTRDLFYTIYSEVEIPPNTPPYNLSTKAPRLLELTSHDLDVLLSYLSIDNPKISVSDDVVKVNLNANSLKDLEPISEKDRAVANLRDTVEQVCHRTNVLSVHIDTCDSKIRKILASSSSNKQSLAKSILKSRKLAQQTQDSTLSMLTKLEQTLASIDSAVNNVEIMEALNQGVTILSDLNKQVGGAEKAAQLVDDLDDAIADTEEIGQQIGALASSTVDEDQVEDELDQMLKEEQDKNQKEKEENKQSSTEVLKNQLDSMPQVPTKPPSDSKLEEKEDDIASQMEKLQI